VSESEKPIVIFLTLDVNDGYLVGAVSQLANHGTGTEIHSTQSYARENIHGTPISRPPRQIARSASISPMDHPTEPPPPSLGGAKFPALSDVLEFAVEPFGAEITFVVPRSVSVPFGVVFRAVLVVVEVVPEGVSDDVEETFSVGVRVVPVAVVDVRVRVVVGTTVVVRVAVVGVVVVVVDGGSVVVVVVVVVG
jgi:hypothetical protein